MAYDLAPLRSYVRFYQTIVDQLQSAWDGLVRTHETARKALEPFGEPLAPVQSAALTAALKPAPTTPPPMLGLWHPQEPKDLTGLTDVYEVVGRFTFQGVDDENLGRIQAVVSTGRNEVHGQRSRLTDLAKLPEVATQCAERLAAQEAKSQAKERAEKLEAFAPLTQGLHQRAQQSIDAVRAVAIPELKNVTTAGDEYRGYAMKVDQVYQTCLPFLRKALADMYEFAGCEVPSSWPDTLPVQRELPAELLSVPPADSPELKHARSALEAMDREETELVRARDDVAVTVARLEGELTAYLNKEAEAREEIGKAGVLVNFANALDQAQQIRRNMASFDQQKADRTKAIGELGRRHKQAEAAIAAMEEELRNRTQEIGQVGEKLAVERDNEPVMFGRDEWRGRVANLEAEVDTLRNGFAQRQGVLNQLKMDMSTLSVQMQTERAQNELVDQWIADAASREKALQESARQLEGQLGPARPLQSPTVAEAEQIHATRQMERAEILERIERFRGDLRRNKEENARIIARLKQIESERGKGTAYVQSAQVAATQGREEALKQLAARRRSSVEQHVAEVVGELEKSLLSVDAVFVEPAKDAMLREDQPRPSAAATIREQIPKISSVLEQLVRELDAQLLAQDAMLGQIQRDFCDAAPAACLSAWG